MKKQTLQFISLAELHRFSRTLNGGYLINTNNFTLTARLHELQIAVAMELYHATSVETTEKSIFLRSSISCTYASVAR